MLLQPDAEGIPLTNTKVLALDLERTLIDDALSGRARPGLRAFLAFCDERFARIVVFTAVEEADAREVLSDLDRAGHLPPGLLGRLEFVAWTGEYKDTTFVPGVPPAEVRLVDDDGGWVRPDQRHQWVPIAPWDEGPDAELARVRVVLDQWCANGEPDAEPGDAPAPVRA